MSHNEQHHRTLEHPTEQASTSPPGILITRVRGYNLFNTIFFGGRRRRLDTALATESAAAPGSHVLDIGCGPGRFAGALADRVGLAGLVVGLDPSGPMVDYASAHAGRRSNCHFRQGAAQSLALPDSSFDVVTATFVMHHIPEGQREAALAQIFRVLRPGGRLMLADMDPLDRVRAGAVRILGKIATHRHETATEDGSAADPFAATDVRNYADTLRRIGFEAVEFRAVKPSTGCLVAVRPG
ncbi:class I SAM-dependent methyltransferase [Rhodococcus chondri]|uniref:Class I SAM-dependent methyltransferase n=1 Tax=Rhodococcus chondri TaxID=3065941 RepID=A0ABU7JV42_9NOCA|nr:class I SAM-dependent methyltransferase [Rhodococcus sp. CC-R104]MEE2033389.1 class I SAM-dependent methyltransferase [Rhodococcus sp. CC-R104]